MVFLHFFFCLKIFHVSLYRGLFKGLLQPTFSPFPIALDNLFEDLDVLQYLMLHQQCLGFQKFSIDQ